MAEKVYLACPFSHPSKLVSWLRYRTANKVSGLLMKQGYVVFSPISHSYAIGKSIDILHDWNFWSYQDFEWVKTCDLFLILMLNGWSSSEGIQDELKVAKQNGIPHRCINYYNGDIEWTNIQL